MQAKLISTAVNLDVDTISHTQFKIRNEFEELDSLAESIKRIGILEPIIVRPKGARYEVVAGSRRLAAVRKLRIRKIPAIARELSDQEAFEVMLTENIQHKTISPLEEARAFYRYLGPKEKSCYGYGKVAELALAIGKSSEYVCNRLSLLKIPQRTLRGLLEHGNISVSHAEELASIANHPNLIKKLSVLVMAKRMTVRELERAVAFINSGIEYDRAVDLARLEADLKVDWNSSGPTRSSQELLFRRSKQVLESSLAYVDEVAGELEHDKDVYLMWSKQVRQRIHDAIDGVLACEKVISKKHEANSPPAAPPALARLRNP